MKSEQIHKIIDFLEVDIIENVEIDDPKRVDSWIDALTPSRDPFHCHNLGMMLAIKQDLPYLELYILILGVLGNLDPKKTIDLLSMRNIRNQTFAQLLGLCKNHALEKEYFKLLKQLANNNNPAILHQLLNNKLLVELPISLIKPGLELIDTLAKHKEKIKMYILNMPEITEEQVYQKIGALKNAVDEKHAVGELFYVQRGLQECDTSKGTLAELQDILNKLTKPKRQLTDVDTYARLFWKPSLTDIKPFNNPTVQCDSYLESGL